MIPWRGLGAPAEDGELPPLHGEPAAVPRWRVVAELPVLVVVAAVVAIVVKAFIAQAFYIPSASMEPQLTAGDRVVVSRLAYDLHDPRRGDVIVFDHPAEVAEPDRSFVAVRLARDALEAVGVVRPRGKELIKRVIGLPGETVEGHDGRVFIDDRPLIEPYLPDDVVISDFPPYTVPDGELFVMGDNRTNSTDSRVFRGVPIDSVVGRAIARVWPPGRIAFL